MKLFTMEEIEKIAGEILREVLRNEHEEHGISGQEVNIAYAAYNLLFIGLGDINENGS